MVKKPKRRSPRKGNPLKGTMYEHWIPAPPLLVGIFRGGKLLKVVEFSDPRPGYCRTFDEAAEGTGTTARPLKSDPRKRKGGASCLS